MKKIMTILLGLLILGCSMNEKAKEPVLIEFKISKNEIPLVQVSIDGNNYTFIIDTGASNSWITSELANRYKKRDLPRYDFAYNAFGNIFFHEKVALTHPVMIGNTSLSINRYCVIDEAEPISLTSSMTRVSGVIGRDFLKKHVLVLDYQQNLGQIIDSTTFSNYESQEKYEHVRMNRQSRIPVTIQGKKINLLLDTGSNGVFDFRHKMMENVDTAFKTESIIGLTDRIAKTPMEYGVLPIVTIGDTHIHRLAVSSNTSPRKPWQRTEGTIGIGFFSEGIVCFDYPAQEFRFKLSDDYNLMRTLGENMRITVLHSSENIQDGFYQLEQFSEPISDANCLLKINVIAVSNPLYHQVGLIEGDEVIEVDDRKIPINSSEIKKIFYLRFNTLTIIRNGERLKLHNQNNQY